LGRKNKTYFFLKSTYFEAGTVINYIETYNTNTTNDKDIFYFNKDWMSELL